VTQFDTSRVKHGDEPGKMTLVTSKSDAGS